MFENRGKYLHIKIISFYTECTRLKALVIQELPVCAKM